MQANWTKHLKDPEEKAKFATYIWSCRQAFKRQLDLLNEKEAELTDSERSPAQYDNPNWEYRQAHKNGAMEMIGFLKALVDLDQQKEPKRDR